MKTKFTALVIMVFSLMISSSVFAEGYLVTSDLWIRAVINTVEKGPIEAIWQKGGEDITSRGDHVIWGHFYASPSDVTWGSENNPDLFVKIWFDISGRVDVNFFHVSVPDIVVYSDYPYDGTPDEQGTTTMSRRYIRQYYENGQCCSEDNYDDGNPPSGYSPTGNPSGYSTINDLRIGSIINTVEKGPIDAAWRFGGQDTTARGDQVVWGLFYASPLDVTWGSQDNPDLFVKIWFDVSGRVDVNFFHVSVPDIDVYSNLPNEGAYDQQGTTVMNNRYIRHEYWSDGSSPTCSDADSDGYYSESGCGTAVDCNDNDDSINPGVTEVCDSKDNNCDGAVDEGGVCGPTEAAWHLFATSPTSTGSPAIWAAADDDAFAGGSNGSVYHYDGKRWMPIETFTSSAIHYIWGFDSNDVYVITYPNVTDSSNVYHYNGTSWELMQGSPVGWSIWGTGPDDLFVASNGGVYHYDGSTWTNMVIPGAFTLWEIWGAAGDDVFVVGNGGKIYHYNGTDWSAMDSGTNSNIWEVWGTASNNVYAITLNAVLHYDGTGWSSIPINIDYPYSYWTSIWGSAADNIYMSTNNTLLFYNGMEWQQVAAVGASNIWGNTGKVFFAGGEIGVYESNAYKTHFFVSTSRIRTVAGSAANNVLLGGMWTYGLLYNGQEWQFLYPTYGQHPNFHFYFAWVIDENNILAGDDDEIKYYDGTDWWSYRIPDYGSIYDNFQDAWAQAQTATEGFVVARSGRVYQFKKDYALTEMDTPTSEDLHGVWGSTTDNVYAVGNGGTILHYGGSDWLEVNNPATQNLNAVWGNGPQDIYAVGNSGTIVHYDGTDWSVMAAGKFSMLFRDVWGFAHDNIYVAGSDGLVHYDGNGWSILDTGYNLDLEAVWGSDPENIYLVDDQGNVYRYSE